MLHLLPGLTLFCGLFLVPANRATAEEPADVRVRFLASCLDVPISELDKGDVALPFLLDTITALASPPGSDKNPRIRVTVMLDVNAFKKENEEPFDPERIQIRFHQKLVSVRFDSVLGMIAAQIDGVVLVRNDFIEIVPREKAVKELGLKLGDSQPMPVLVNRFFTNVSPQKALQQIAERYNQNIVISPHATPAADEKNVKLITARLVNVPIETAVETIANMADLKVIHKANVFYVTTKEQADVLSTDHEKLNKATPEKKRLFP